MRACLLVVIAASLAAPTLAEAHIRSGTLSTDFDARVGGFRPAAPGLAARVLGGDQRLELRVAPAQLVIVLGIEGEPFLRFSATGVEANLASPTAATARVIRPSEAVFSGRPRWQSVSRGHVFAWHENRLRPVPFVHDGSIRPRQVGTWSIPLVVDGRRTALGGAEWYAAGPPVWPWLLAGALVAAAAGLGAQWLSRRMQRLLVSVLLSVAVGALLAGWFGILVAGRVTWLAVVFGIVFAAVSALLLLTSLAAVRGTAQLGVMALIGAFTATFALPELPVFGHGFVLSSLPAFAARLAAASAVIGGTAVAILCIPAVIEVFDLPPLAEP
jgi:hypothetical protein